ncbi:MAG: hypothetical protein WCO13_11125 [Bacteroidota bacterium]
MKEKINWEEFSQRAAELIRQGKHLTGGRRHIHSFNKTNCRSTVKASVFTEAFLFFHISPFIAK